MNELVITRDEDGTLAVGIWNESYGTVGAVSISETALLTLVEDAE